MKRFHSLKFPLSLLLALAVLGTSVSIYLIQSNALERSLLLREQDRAANSYRLCANIFSEETDEMMALAHTLAEQPSVTMELNSTLSLSNLRQAGSNADALRQIQGQLASDLGEERNLSLINRHGSLIYQSESDHLALSLTSWGVNEALAGESLLITTKHAGHWEVRALAPVKSDQEVLGVLMVSVNLVDLLERVEAIVETDIFLLNYDGVQAETGGADAVSKPFFDQSLINQILEEEQVQIIQSDDGLLLYYYQMFRVADEVFCLVIEEDLRPAQQLLVGQRQETLWVTLIILTTTLLVSSLAGGWLLRPLKRLRQRAESFGEQLTGINAVSPQGDEVTSLVLTFNSMFDELQKHEARVRQEHAQLEERVHSRTHLLNQQNKQLCREVKEHRVTEEKLREKEQHLNHLAHHDPLTGLPNRTLLGDRLVHGLEKAIRYNHQAGLLFLDLDRFKTINDTIGHAAGDQILIEIAARLRALVRHSDTLARVGGDEFVVFLEEVKDTKHVSLLAQKIIDSMAAPLFFAGKPFYLSMSIGISLYPVDGTDAETLMKYADVAMYRAKAQGGATYRSYTPEMNARAHELLELERGLHTCIEDEQLILHYQPQLDLNTEELVGVEALLRWQTPDRGLIQPKDFIPLAEQTGLIVAMGEWVLKTACLQYMKWQEQGFPSFRMAVNLSPRQFRQGNLVATVSRVLRKTGMKPQNLELEITESMVMDDVDTAIITMQKLADMGITLAIDDFGSGYSSLAYLKKFPISKLKIDRAFVRDIPNDRNDMAIAIAAIALAKSMDLETIAEGIETDAQLNFLRSQGCSQGQGYFFGRPVESGELTARWGQVS